MTQSSQVESAAQRISSEQHCSAGISEPLPVAATFYMPDASGSAMDKYATIDTMVCAWPGLCLRVPTQCPYQIYMQPDESAACKKTHVSQACSMHG